MQFWLIVAIGLAFSVSPANAKDQIVDTRLKPSSVSVTDFCSIEQIRGDADATTCIQGAIDYAYKNNINAVTCPGNSNFTTSAPIYQDPPGNLRTSLKSPTIFAFSLSFIGLQGPNHEGKSCKIRNSVPGQVAWWIGPGQGMILKGVNIVGSYSTNGYRCNLPSTGIGVAIAGGGGGSSKVIIENVAVDDEYNAFAVGTNNGAMAEMNTWRNIFVTNACRGIYIASTQAFGNNIDGAEIQATYSIEARLDTHVNIIGGNFSSATSAWKQLNVSGSALTCKGQSCTVAMTVASDPDAAAEAKNDAYLSYVYSGFPYRTPSYGVVPFTKSNYSKDTNRLTLHIPLYWLIQNGYWDGRNQKLPSTSFGAEIAAMTSIYAVERVFTFVGGGINVYGAHIENPNAATTAVYANTTFGRSAPVVLENVKYNFDPVQPHSDVSLPGQAQALFFASQVFPFYDISTGSIIVRNLYGPSSIYAQDRVVVSTHGDSGQVFQVENSWDFRFNSLCCDDNSFFYMINSATPLSGIGELNRWQNLPPILGTQYSSWAAGMSTNGYYSSAFEGVRPDPKATPCSRPGDLVNYTGGKLGTFSHGSPPKLPPLFGGQIYRLCAIKISESPNVSFYSNHRWWSYGQALPPTSWSYVAGSSVLKLSNTDWFFPGLGILLNNGSGDAFYVVTGVYPRLGYVTVLRTENDWPTGGLAGVMGSTYTGSTVGQEPFSIHHP